MQDRKQHSPKRFFQVTPEQRKYIFIIILLAVAARIIYLIQLQHSIFYGNYILDSRIIDLWAKEIASGNFWGSEAFFRAPLYPYIVALFYKLFGTGPLAIVIFQNLLGVGTAILTFFYARYLLGEKPAMIAGIMAALWPTLIYFEGELMITTLAVFLTLAAVIALHLAIESGNVKKYLLAGILLGLAAITRPTVLALVLIIPVYYLIVREKKMKGNLLRIGAYFAVGLLIPILPVTLRNAAVAHDPVLISTQGGANFYIGNSRYADGRSVVMPMQNVTYKTHNEDFIYAQSKILAEKKMGRKLKDSQVSSFWFREALSEIKQNPPRAMMLFLSKYMFFWHGQEIFNNKSPYVAGEYSGYMKLSIWKAGLNFPSGLLFPLMLVGAYLVINEKKNFKVPLLYLLIFSLTISVFFVCARFRQPIIPVAIILAAYAIYSFGGMLKKNAAGLMSMIVIFAVTGLALNLGGDVESVKNRSQFENIQGTVYLKKKMYPEAINHLKESLSIAPDNRSAIGSLSYAYLMAGQVAQAEKTLVKGISDFPESSDLHYNLATLYYRMGEVEASKPLFERTLQLDPSMPDPYMALGMIYESQEQPDSARAIYKLLLERIPNFQAAQTKLKELDAQK